MRHGQPAREMQDDMRVLPEPAKCEGVPEFVDEDGDENDHDPDHGADHSVRAGPEQESDHPEKWVNADGDPKDRETKVKLGWGRDLK